ncbi:transketolase family protein [Olsenella sp. HMSC062G07]|uniref:transketolase family protein n=1 Tax=Olsenella sp. HMSC062G07 TaxID=1739330 RepID=UPI0008A2E0DE|nr:transketolase C-terminal domain-containing protein [Olsenella sp. HMSC062G07]OFK22145.1 hypothetical protein HMPREF2826_02705 [Olsenella sp. HMSC062G07]
MAEAKGQTTQRAAAPDLLVSAEDARRLSTLSHKDVFGEVMGRLATTDASLSVVVSDYGRRLNLSRFRELCPEGFVQCGIAEQNQVEVASALANEGLTTFAPSYATFITSRVLDQVRVNLGIMASPVALVGVGCGCDAAILGASHMALEDLGVMRQIPGMTVVSPCDNAEFAATLLELGRAPRPAYVRMNEAWGANLHPGGVGRAPGRPHLLRRAAGARVALVSTGTISCRALRAAELLAAEGIEASVLALPTVKPLDAGAIDALGAPALLASVEEHSVVGGLGSALAEALAERGRGTALLRLGLPDRYLEADARDAVLARAGLDPAGIAAQVRDGYRRVR